MPDDLIKVISRPVFSGLAGDITDAQQYKKIIVSMPVGEYLANNPDVLPDCEVYGVDSSPKGAIRDNNGAIIGTTQFVRYR